MLCPPQICHSNYTCTSFTCWPAKFKYTFAVAWQIPKENSSYCPKLSSSLKYIKVPMALCVFNLVLFYISFGKRSEWSRALQLLIKMLIRICLWGYVPATLDNVWSRRGIPSYSAGLCLISDKFQGIKSVHSNWPKPVPYAHEIGNQVYHINFSRGSLH